MAKINRFTRLSPSRFTPRSVEEIMMVPLAKQQQHNVAEAKLDELESFDYNRLTGDNEAASQELADYRNKVGEAVDSLATSGVSNVNRSRVLDLNRELKKNMSSEGKWGRRKANYDAYKAWTEEMKKKDNRGGWSSRAVQTFMGQESSGFKSENEDGTFNQFKGGQLPDYVDVQEKIDKLLKNVPETVIAQLSDQGLVHNGQINLTDIYTKKTVKGKDSKLIFDYLSSALGSDKKVLESVMMENRLDGFQEKNPLAMNGKFVDIADPATGTTVKQFQPSSALEAKIYANTMAASGITDVNTKYLTIKDEIGVAAMKAELDRKYSSLKGLDGAITYGATVLQQVTPEGFGQLTNEMNNLSAVLAQAPADLEKIANEYRSESDPSGKENPMYKRAVAEIKVTGKKLLNLQGVVNDYNSRGAQRLKEDDRPLYKASKEYSSVTTDVFGETLPDEALRIKLIEDITNNSSISPEALSGTSIENLKEKFFEKRGIDSEVFTKSDVHGTTIQTSGEGSILDKLSTEVSSKTVSKVDMVVRDIQKQVSNYATEVIKEDNENGIGAQSSTILSASDSDFSNKIMYEASKTLSGDNFRIQDYSESINGEEISNLIEDQINESDEDKAIDLTKTRVDFMTGTTSSGNPQFYLSFFTKAGMPVTAIAATKGQAGANFYNKMGRENAKSFNNSTRDSGEKMMYNNMATVTKTNNMEENSPVKNAILAGYQFLGNNNATWSKRKISTTTLGDSYDYRLNLLGREDTESTELRSLDEVNEYLYLISAATTYVNPGDSEAVSHQRWAQNKFESRFGREEAEKYAENE